MKKVYFDTEFTGLHAKTTLVSIGLITEDGDTFYAELTDYDKTQLDGWLETNVIGNLTLQDLPNGTYITEGNTTFKGTKEELAVSLSGWLKHQGAVEMWSDCLAYDWVLFLDIFGGAFQAPENIYYIPFDICVLFKNRHINPDISREEFAMLTENPHAKKHNALWDAEVIKKCHEILTME
jgi:hypothetical protein